MQEKSSKLLEFYLRLNETLVKHGLSISSVENKLALGRGTLNNAIKKGSSLGMDKVFKILEMFPNEDLNWLLKGEVKATKENTLAPETHNGKIVPEYDNVHIRETLKYVREELERQHTQLVKTTRATEELQREVNDLKAQMKA